MTKRTQRVRLSPRAQRRLLERSAELYVRELERWNSRTPLPERR